MARVNRPTYFADNIKRLTMSDDTMKAARELRAALGEIGARIENDVVDYDWKPDGVDWVIHRAIDLLASIEAEVDDRAGRLMTAIGIICNADDSEMRDVVPKMLRSSIAQKVWKAFRPICRACDQTAVVQRSTDGAGACEDHPFPSPELSVPDFAAHTEARYREASDEVAKLKARLAALRELASSVQRERDFQHDPAAQDAYTDQSRSRKREWDAMNQLLRAAQEADHG